MRIRDVELENNHDLMACQVRQMRVHLPEVTDVPPPDFVARLDVVFRILLLHHGFESFLILALFLLFLLPYMLFSFVLLEALQA